MRWNRPVLGPPLRLPRPGLVLRRHPRAWWAVVACGALAAGVVAARYTAGVEAVRAGWGRTVPVVVATEPVPAGGLLAGRTTVEQRPLASVPDEAVDHLPAEARAAHPLTRGQVLTHRSLAGGRLSAVAARLPSGSRAVAIPTEPGLTPPLSVGDRVDVLVTVAADLAGDGPPGFVLVPDAVVVDVAEPAVTVAVPAADAPRLAVALGTGAVSLALTGR